MVLLHGWFLKHETQNYHTIQQSDWLHSQKNSKQESEQLNLSSRDIISHNSQKVATAQVSTER